MTKDKKIAYPSHELERFIVRLPDGMRRRIFEVAAENGRSMNTEIVKRLEASFEGAAGLIQLGLETGKTIESQAAEIRLLEGDIERLRQARDELLAKSVPGLPIELTDAAAAIRAMEAATKVLKNYTNERRKKVPVKKAPRGSARRK